YTALYKASSMSRPEELLPPCAMDIQELAQAAENSAKAEDIPLIFLGDGVPVFKEALEKSVKAPHSYAPAANNRQRAASVGALGELLFSEGKFISGDDFVPFYLRPSQAERVRAEKMEQPDSTHEQG
ncbi:MAG: tRNA (adenosine(37)-N6)-threonylcarbamoyltransferase complex dimerization subunit type 1 TsaB, partial [Lachnospiraceae bacterium]|nr:tRNA (adenosine(37)-N6)-threonylcarbamoyltransferase complex dimerization subunit type 1 TsaB [Lachnospiraceae bacterium]